MKSVVLLLVLFGLSSVLGQSCTQPGLSASPQNLTFCTQYSASACCTPATEATVIQAMAAARAIYGNSSCYENSKDFTCAVACSPNQTQFNTLTIGSPSVLVGYLALDFAQQWYGSCKNACIANGGVTVQLFTQGNLTTFLYLFSTDSDPNYVPSISNPRIVFSIGNSPSPASGTFNETAHSGYNVFPPCPPAATTAAGTSATATVVTTTKASTASPGTSTPATTSATGASTYLFPSLVIALAFILLCQM